MQEFEPIDVKFIVNNDEVKAASDKVKADIASTGQTADEVTAKTNAQIAQLVKTSAKENKALADKKLIMKSVSDKYRGLLNEGLSAYKGLDAKSRTLTIQLQNNREALTEVGLAQKELTRNFELGRISATDYTRSQGALATKEAQLRNDIKLTSNALNQQSGAIRRTKPQWNGLGNSINQMSRELPAFTVSAQTGILALSNNIPIFTDEIGKLVAKNKMLKQGGEKTIPVWRQLLKGFLSWQTILSVGVTLLTVYGKEIGILFKKLFNGKTAIDEVKRSAQALNKAFENSEYTKAVKDISELNSVLNLVKKGYADADVFVNKYNESLGKVAGSVDTVKEAEIGLQANADAYLKMMFYKGAAAAALADGNKEIIENEKRKVEIENELIQTENKLRKARQNPLQGLQVGQGGVLTDEIRFKQQRDKLKNKINALKQEQTDLSNASASLSNRFFEKAAKIAEAANLKLFGGKGSAKVISSRQNLLDKLTAIDNEYARKSLTSDKAELKALRDKFAKMRLEIERFNAKNKKNPIDITGLGVTQINAEKELKFNQETNKLKEEIATKKKLFENFETYKAQFGLAKAKEQFKDQLGAYDSYLNFLKQKVRDNAAIFKAVASGSATAGQVGRVKLLDGAVSTETEKREKQFNDILAGLMSFSQKKQLIEERYQAKKAKLIAGGHTSELAELDRQHNLELAKLNSLASKLGVFYKKAFGDLSLLGITTIKNLALEAKTLLDSAKFKTNTDGTTSVMIDKEELNAEGEMVKKTIPYTIQQFTTLQKKYNQLNGIVRSNNPFKAIAQDFKDLQDAIASGDNDAISNKITALNGSIHQSIAVVNQWGDSLGQIFGKDTAADIKVLTDMASGVTDLGTGIAQLATGDIIGGITNTLKGAAKIYTTLTAGAKAFREEQVRFADELIALNLQLNAVLNEQLRLQKGLNSSVFITDYAHAIFQASIALKEAQANYISVLNGQDLTSFLDSLLIVVDKKQKKFLGIVTGYKNIYGSLLEQYPALIDSNGQFNASLAERLLSLQDIPKATQQGLEALIEYQKQIEANQKAMEDAISSIAGSISNDLRNALVDAWDKGTDAFLAFKGSVNKGLKQIVEQMVFNAIFAKSFADLQKSMEASFGVGGDGSVIDDLKAFYDQAPALIEAWQNAMGAATDQASAAGFDISAQSDPTKQQGLSGAIRRSLTEDTGNELAGLFRGQYDVTKNILTVNQEATAALKKSNNSTLEILGHTAKIEANTANTVLRLDAAITELKAINKNTVPSAGTRDLGD